MYRDAYPSDRSVGVAYPSAAYVSDAYAAEYAEDEDASFGPAHHDHAFHSGYGDDDHEVVWARHFRQFAHASAPFAPAAHVPSNPPARPRSARSGARRRGPLLLLLAAATVPAIAVMTLAGRPTGEDAHDARTIAHHAPQIVLQQPVLQTAMAARESAAPAPVARHAWMLDPAPVMGDQAATIDESSPLESDFPSAPMQIAEAVEALLPPPAKYERAPLLRDKKPTEPRQILAQTVPLPQPRPADLMPPKPVTRMASAERTISERNSADPATTGSLPTGPHRLSDRAETARRELPSTQSVFRAAIPGRANGGRSSDSALAYAGTNEEAIDVSPRARLGLSPNPASGQTAIYDISAQRVYLPSGRVLEAHSGKGEYMDDPRYVHLRMRGATPPGTYMLTERERPYHGVRALRMTPVGGTAAIHGRDGILAHTYMLRQRGASHGCVVFADYRAFLGAYLNGEIRQIKVVSGAKGGALPAVAGRVRGFFDRWASADE